MLYYDCPFMLGDMQFLELDYVVRETRLAFARSNALIRRLLDMTWRGPIHTDEWRQVTNPFRDLVQALRMVSVRLRLPHAAIPRTLISEHGDPLDGQPLLVPAWHPAMLAVLEGFVTEMWAWAAILRATPGVWILQVPQTYDDLKLLA